MADCPPSVYTVSASASAFPFAVNLKNVLSIDVPIGATDFVLHVDTYSDSGNTGVTAITLTEADGGGTEYVGPDAFTLHGHTYPHTFSSIGLNSHATKIVFGALVDSNDGHACGFSASGWLTWSGSCDPSVQCAYGTQPKSGDLDSIIITFAILQAVALAFGQPELAILLAGVIGGVLQIKDMCSALPPKIPDSFNGVGTGNWPVNPTLADCFTYFQDLVWSQYCECKPATGGGTPPVAPPAPVVSPPGTGTPPTTPVPLPPSLACDGTDLCGVLNNIIQIDQTINAGVQQLLYALSHLVVPGGGVFSYKYGRTHFGLVGAGEFLADSGLVGVAIQMTGIPDANTFDLTIPETTYRVGVISFGTVDGWTTSIPVRHNPHLMLPVPPTTTRIGWTFEGLVIGAIVQLVLI